ncbi:MAG: hypothetical protein FWG12_06310 [Holophagaceae bacterium]|nr:hypothetical protein [Holophagaceae bacterium]
MQNSNHSFKVSIGANYAGFDTAMVEITKSLQRLTDQAKQLWGAIQNSADKSMGETKRHLESVSPTVEEVREQFEESASAFAKWSAEGSELADKFCIDSGHASSLVSAPLASRATFADAAKKALQIEADRMFTEQRLRELDLDNEQAALNHRYQMGQITALQLVELEKDIIGSRYELKMEGLRKELELELLTREEFANEVKLMDKDLQLALIDNARQAALEQKAIWQDVANSIKASMEDALVGLMNGTMSWGDATKSVLNSVLQAFIKKTTQELVQHMTIENMKSLFTKKIAAQEIATKAAASAQSKGITIANATTDIGATAPVAGAKAFSAMASIPFVGPALGAAAMAAAIGAIMALMGKLNSAAGGWGQVPSDQLAMVHKNEMILPAKYAEPLREQLEGGDMGGSPIVINLSAMDAKSSYGWMKDNAGQFRELIKQQVRDFAFG